MGGATAEAAAWLVGTGTGHAHLLIRGLPSSAGCIRFICAGGRVERDESCTVQRERDERERERERERELLFIYNTDGDVSA